MSGGGQAARSLMRSPGFTVVVIATLALGIGANSAIFTVVNAFFLRPLPVSEPGGLVVLSHATSNGGKAIGKPSAQGARMRVYSHPLYELLRAQRDVFAGLAAEDGAGSGGEVRWGGTTAFGYGRAVSTDYFQVLGVGTAVGRTTFAEQEGAVVLAHHFWQRHFGSDPAVVGARVALEGIPVTVVGVAAAGFTGTKRADATDFWFPLGLKDGVDPIRGGPVPRALADRERWWLRLVGRLRPGVSLTAAEAVANLVFQRHLADHWPAEARIAPRIQLEPGAQGFTQVRDRYRTQLTVLMAGVGLLLVIVFTNVSQLFLARTLARRRELVVRAALGATRLQLLRQPMSEAFILAALGGVGGLLLSRWLIEALLLMAVTDPVRDSLNVAADLRVVGFTVLLSLASALVLVVGIAGHARPQPLLGARHVAAAPKSVLLTVQVALSMVLLVGAALLLATFVRVRGAERGIDQEHLFVVGMSGLAVPPALAQSVEALPGVTSAGLSSQWPDVEGRGVTVDGSGHRANLEFVTPGHFETLGMRLMRGRRFNESDAVAAGRPAVISAGLARALAPGGEALGARFRLAAQPREALPTDTLEVVGVVDDLVVGNPRRRPTPVIYLAARDWAAARLTSLTLRVHAGVDARQLTPGLQAVLRGVDARLAGAEMRPFATVFTRFIRAERLLATLATVFGLASAILVCLGLSGVVAQWVSQRTREIGVRMAIGASPSRILGMLLRQALTSVGAGVVMGIPAAMMAGHLLRGSLYGVSASSPSIWLGAVLIMVFVSVSAAYVPARRASRVDPMIALRQE